jgi:hypothetical protein
MKTIFSKFLPVSLALLLFFGLSSCKKSSTGTNNSTAPPDPAGTNVVNLLTGTGIVLDDTVNAFQQNGYNTLFSFYTNSISLDLDANLNLSMSYAAGVNAPYGLNYTLGCSNGIINLGTVSGLGTITTHPTTGYSSTSLAQAGSGYIVESVDNNPDGSHLDGTSTTTYTSVPRTLYYRIFISATVTTTSNAVAGYTIKYQGPF